jgi:hypothetical protein
MAWEIQQRGVVFNGGSNEATATPIAIVAPFPGATRIRQAFCAIASFDIVFLNDDHHVKQVGISLAPATIRNAGALWDVFVSGTLPFRDKDRFDDRYRVTLSVLIIADVER